MFCCKRRVVRRGKSEDASSTSSSACTGRQQSTADIWNNCGLGLALAGGRGVCFAHDSGIG